jgi:hypothetical protein
MNLKRILIGESEKSRILSLHENLKTESSKLLMEQDSETTTKYFEEQKKKYSNFPDGKVVPVEGGFAYQTNNGIFLYPNGTAYNSQGVKSTENWTDEPYVAVTTATGQATTATGQATTATGQATTATGQATTATGQATTATGQSTIKPVSFESLPTDKDLRQSSKSEEKSKRSDAKQQLKNTQKRINDCTEAINNYIKYNLGSKPDTDKTKQQYVNYLKTNCSGIDEIDLTIVGL